MLQKTSLNDAYSYIRFELCGSLFTATIFGRPLNWSLSQLSAKDEKVREEFSGRLGRALRDLRIGKALAPSPVKFSDRIIASEELTAQVEAGSHSVWRYPQRPADGVPIRSGEACVFSPSSCPTTLMVRGKTALVLHTGRDCLLDRYRLQHGMRGRTHESICFSGLEHLGTPREVYVKPFWGIPGALFPHDLEHPVYSRINQAMYKMISERWGGDCVPRKGGAFYPDLPKLIRAQCMEQGVPKDHIDLAHAYQPAKATWLDGKAGTPRNAVVIARHS